MRFVFNERKATQAAAKLLEMQGGRMPYIKLIKLLYLADRQSLIETGYPITGDRLVSLDHGPVLSRVLDFITWGSAGGESSWVQCISAPERYEVSLIAGTEFDELSEYEIDVLIQVCSQFGELDRWDLVKYTHSLPEWIDPHGSCIDIDVRTILEDAGKSEKEIQGIAAEVEAIRAFSAMYAVTA